MKGNKRKTKSIFALILTLVVIVGLSVTAYLACTIVSKGQSTTVAENVTENAEGTNDQTGADTQEDQATDQTTDQTEENKEETAATDSNAETVTEDTASAETSEKESLISKIFGDRHIHLGLDLQGGVNIVYEPKLDRSPTEDEMAAAKLMIQKRLDAKGYTEAEASIEGTNRIRVEIPGVDDPQKAIDEIGAAGMLRFLDQEGNEILDGSKIASASAQYYTENGTNKYGVSVQMNEEGTEIFKDFTTNHQGEMMLIMLDNTVLSYPTIQAVISDGKGMISGTFTAEEAKDLADGINAGSLPFALDAVTSTGIGAKLGLDALNTSLMAGAIGLILIMIFMIAMYRLCGVAADIALTLYIALVVLVLSFMNATLTLPGIAGLLLSVGMAVDANVIIFVRIKEEMASGKTVRSAVDAGFSKAFSAILDGNITTLIASGVLYIFGTGLIKSFATTLGIGIIISMFTALVITRFILKCFVGMDIRKPSLYAKVKKQSEEA
nr:protein translocase subunit SecD [uncultured Cellulosilyticum sp.]